MQRIIWEVQYLSPPLAVRYCKKCGTKSQLKVSTILREKLYLSQKAFDQMLACGQIKSISGIDLRKYKLHSEVVLAIGSDTGHHAKGIN